MATTKNITMKQFNGTDYDTLYPKTIASQVDGVYNKDETLTDSTKASFGLPSTAVPDDVFKQLQQSSSRDVADLSKIGDCLTTARKDLGNKWLLCNGDEIDASEYPELADAIKSIYGQYTGSNYDNSALRVNSVASYNGLWVAVGRKLSNPYIWITNTPAKKGTIWTEKEISTSVSVSLNLVDCYNGTWVACGADSNGYCYIFTTTDPTGTWTSQKLDSSTVFRPNDIMCYDGTWVLVGYTSNTAPCICVSTNPSGGWSVTKLDMDSKNYGSLTGITYANNKWVASGYLYNSAISDATTYIWYADTISGTWVPFQVSETLYMGNGTKIAYDDGMWVIAGSNNSGIPYVWYTNNLLGNWTEKQLSTTPCLITDMAFCNGLWTLVGYNSKGSSSAYYPTIFTASVPDGAWTIQELSTKSIALNSIYCVDNMWVAVGRYQYTSGSNTYYQAYTYSNSFALLPTFSNDIVYTYIKALE